MSLYTLQDTDGTSNRITFVPGSSSYLGNSLSTYQTLYDDCGFESNTSYFNVVNGIQLWKVPTTGTYEIEVAGAGGGSTYLNNRLGGAGRVIRGTVDLTSGDILRIIVGSRGGRFQYTAGGGGASAVGPGISMTNAGTASGTTGRWIIAGAGGGGGNSGGNGKDANTGESASAGNTTYGGGQNTSAGTGGRTSSTSNGGWGGGGAGWTSNGGGNNNSGSCNYQSHYNAIKLNSSSAPNGAYNSTSCYSNPFEDSSRGSCGGAAGGFGGGGNGACNGGGAGAGYTGGSNGGAGGGSYFNTTAMSSRVDVGTRARDTNGYVKITLTATAAEPIPTSNITFTILKERYNDSGITSASGHSNLLSSDALYTFTSHTFTNCGATGHTGPSLSNCTSSYGGSNNWWNDTDYFNVGGASGVNGIQIWTVPDTGYYEVDAYGARGGGILNVPSGKAGGGLGARMKSRFSLTQGDKYMILCGQQGGPGANVGLGSSGGGGTFFVKGDNYSNVVLADLQLAAGGGGGRGSTAHSSTSHGQPGQNGTSNSTAGGSAGNYGAGGGGGLISNGSGNGYSPSSFTGGYSFKNGGEGGTPGTYTTVTGQYGGFGGGGGASVHSGSGGGGVYGGNGANPFNGNPNGKGGGSHNKGTSIVSTSGQNDGDGKIIITATTSSGTPRTVSGSSSTTIELSYFRNATFTSGSAVPSSGAISINTDFKGRTFGTAALEAFPVTSNPSIQWIVGGMEAEKSNVSSINGTGGETIDPEGYWSGISIPGTDEWITNGNSGKTVTRYSYTNADNDTIYYLNIPVASDFTTKINTSGNMASSGFTGWWVLLGPSSTNSWWRPFSYRGIATGDTQSISNNQTMQSSTQQYHGPLWFLNSTYGNRMEFRKPQSGTSNAVTAYPLSSGGVIWDADADYVWILIWKISSGGITKYTSCVRDKSNGFYKPSTVADRENVSTFASSHSDFQGSSQFGLKSSTNVGKPWFNDSRYGSNTDSAEEFNLISSGWANREYSDSETNLLRNKLKDLYFGTGRGTT